MPNELVMRGQTDSGETEILNFGGHMDGYAYRLTEFSIYPSTNVSDSSPELMASLTAGKTAVAPTDPNFDDPGLIGVACLKVPASSNYGPAEWDVINDLFVITQDLILMVFETYGTPVNWQCKFEKVKLSASAEAVANFNQFTISDG